jgi:hypothetical protein
MYTHHGDEQWPHTTTTTHGAVGDGSSSLAILVMYNTDDVLQNKKQQKYYCTYYGNRPINIPFLARRAVPYKNSLCMQNPAAFFPHCAAAAAAR